MDNQLTTNGLQEPFIDFLRNLLDNEDNKIIMPMFNAFAEDVKRLSAQPSGLRFNLEPVGDKPVFQDPELVKTKELLKEVHDSFCEVLGVSTASGDAHWTKLVQAVRELKQSDTEIREQCRGIFTTIEESNKKQLAEALKIFPMPNELQWFRLFETVKAVVEDLDKVNANNQSLEIEKSRQEPPSGAYVHDLAEALGLEGEYSWDELLRGVAVHVKQSKELPIVKARVIELESGGCRKKLEGEARLIGGSGSVAVALPKPEGSKSGLTPAQIERNEKMRIGRERYQAEQRAKKETTETVQNRTEVEPEISAAAETLIEAVNNDIGDTPGPEALDAHQEVAAAPRIYTPRDENRVVPSIGCEFPWPYSFSPEVAAGFLAHAVAGTSIDAIIVANPDLENFFEDRGGLVRTIRSMSPEARRGKVVELQKSWLEGLTRHGRCGDA